MRDHGAIDTQKEIKQQIQKRANINTRTTTKNTESILRDHGATNTQEEIKYKYKKGLTQIQGQLQKRLN